MVMTLEDAFKMFKENPDTKIGCSSFKKLKPKNVRKVSETSRRTCLCTKCCNVALKVQALKKFIATSSPENKDLADKMTKAYLCDAVVCAYSSHPDKKCLERECNQCPKLESCFEALRDHYQAIITWCHWEYIQIHKDGSVKRCISCVEKKTPILEFITCLAQDMEQYPYHIFRAEWQYKQMSNCIHISLK